MARNDAEGLVDATSGLAGFVRIAWLSMGSKARNGRAGMDRHRSMAGGTRCGTVAEWLCVKRQGGAGSEWFVLSGVGCSGMDRQAPQGLPTMVAATVGMAGPKRRYLTWRRACGVAWQAGHCGIGPSSET